MTLRDDRIREIRTALEDEAAAAWHVETEFMSRGEWDDRATHMRYVARKTLRGVHVVWHESVVREEDNAQVEWIFLASRR